MALGYDEIKLFHMNEGHSSLLTLELLNERAAQAGGAPITIDDLEAVPRAVFDEAGLDYPTNDWTWDDFLEAAIHKASKAIMAKAWERSQGFVDKMKEAGLPADDQQRIALKARQQIVDTVYPAYQRLIDYFIFLDDKVSENNGVWALPDGDNFYRLAVRLFTTTDYTPEFLHEFGLSEVER